MPSVRCIAAHEFVELVRNVLYFLHSQFPALGSFQTKRISDYGSEFLQKSNESILHFSNENKHQVHRLRLHLFSEFQQIL